jgi:oligopeptide transport system substrate-binding protein
MRKSLVSALLVLVAAFLLVGMTLSKTTRVRADFSFVNGTEPKTLDPHLATGAPEHRVLDELFEGLARLEAKTLAPVPGAAESWDVTPDGKTYIFHIRKNARWSDGRPLTAHDFTYAWRRLQQPQTASEYAYIMHMVRYAEAFNTHEEQGKALQGAIPKALDELTAKHPKLIPRAALVEFRRKLNLDAVLKGSPSPVLRAFLMHPPGDMPASELEALRGELGREGDRRAALYREAAQRFGVDGGVFARDDHTLVVELNAPTPYFLELTTFYPFFPVPRWVIERPGNAQDWFAPGKLVGNGAFALASWRVGDRIRLERSGSYWGKSDVKLRFVDALPVENQTTALNLYLTGEVDWLPSNTYPPDLAPDLSPRDDYYSGPALIVYYYRINTTRKPFDDKRVRKALNLAIDREQLTRHVLGQGQTPAYGFVPPSLPDYQQLSSAISYDPEQARKLLAEAGFPDGRGFPKFGILFNTMEAHRKIAEVIADQLRRNLNLNVLAYNQEWQSYQEATRNFDYDLARMGWVGDYEDPNTFLDLWITNGGNNQTGWGNLVYDRLIDAAADVEQFIKAPEFLLDQTREPAELKRLADAIRSTREAAPRLRDMAKLRLKLLAEAEALLVQQEFPAIPLYYYVISGLARTNLQGFYPTLESSDGQRRPNLRDIHPLRDISVDAKPGVPWRQR